MEMNSHGLLVNVMIYLAATVIAVPLAKRVGLGSVLGYLLAGVAVGPWGLGLISNVQDILHFAEFGVVLLLFLIGLELNPARLWAMRGPVFGMGSAQVLVTAALLLLAGYLSGLSVDTALIVALGLSLSSTAIALQVLTEKALLRSRGGQSVFSVLLFQDIAVIPILAVISFLGSSPESEGVLESGWLGLLEVTAVIAGIIVGGRYLVRPVFRVIAATGLREVFTAFSLLLVIGVALLMQMVDMSMALGAFLGGVLLADSEYRHELEVEIEPFKGLLLGLFFVAVGMSVDFSLLQSEPWLVLGLVGGLLLLKMLVLVAVGRMFKLPAQQTPMFAILLAQGGEFAFVIFSLAQAAGVVDGATSSMMVLVVTLSMAVTPLLMVFNDRVLEPKHRQLGEERPDDEVEHESHPVVIAGFGRFGQVVGRMLLANRVTATILDHDPEHIERMRRFGFKVYYGDPTRPDLLAAAGVADAKVLVVAVDDVERATRIIEVAQQRFPNVTIVARAHDTRHAVELQRAGVHVFQKEVFASAVLLSEEVLKLLGFGAYYTKRRAQLFARHDAQTIEKMAHEPEEKRVDMYRQAREEIEKIFAEEKRALNDESDAGWG